MSVKNIKWVIAHEPIGLFLKVAEAFSKEVNEKTGGKFNIEILSLTDYSEKYNFGQPLTKRSMIDLVGTGKVQMGHIYTTWLADINPDLNVLDLPFLFRDHDHADAILDGDIGAELLAGVEKNSEIKAMAFTYSGGYRIVPANFKAETVDSWKGKKVRISSSPVAKATFETLGAIPNPNIELDQMNQQADLGNIDAGESTYVRIFPLEQNKSFKFINDTEHSLFLTSIIVNEDFFNQFDEETKEIMSTAAFNAAKAERHQSVADIPGILEQCRNESVEVVAMSDAEKQKMKDLLTPLQDKFAGAFSSGLVSRIKSH